MRAERGPGWEIRLGRFQDVLADVERCDSIITDPPYLGACADIGTARGDSGAFARGRSRSGSVMGYEPASASLLNDLCEYAEKRCDRWFLAFNDFDGAAHMRAFMKARNHVVAEPIAWVKPPTLTPPRGGLCLPKKGTEFITCARFKSFEPKDMPGAYVSPRNTPSGGTSLCVTGGKPLDLMRAIIRDFTRPGDLLVEPFSGGGTTLLAAVMEGRSVIASEMDPANFETTVKRLRKGYTTSLFTEQEPQDMKQEVMF